MDLFEPLRDQIKDTLCNYGERKEVEKDLVPEGGGVQPIIPIPVGQHPDCYKVCGNITDTISEGLTIKEN